MDVETRIQDMTNEELDRLLKVLNFALSGSEIGEGEAFQFLAEIESKAINEKTERGSSGWIPDEQLAGYIG